MKTISTPNNEFHLDLSEDWEAHTSDSIKETAFRGGVYVVVCTAVSAPLGGRANKENAWKQWLQDCSPGMSLVFNPVPNPAAGISAGESCSPAGGTARHFLVWSGDNVRCWQFYINRMPGASVTVTLRIPSRNLSVTV